jgi:uncharacterized membrane protein (UPF0127 family)
VKHVFGALIALVLLTTPGCKAIGEGATNSASSLASIPLSITTSSGVQHKFKVEVARTGEEQQRGLMFRESLPPFGGMLFPYTTPQPVSFWMKNTVIPLDMIFIRQDRTIARIAAETTPYSLDQVSSGEPIVAVLEIAGGRAAALDINEGDSVRW